MLRKIEPNEFDRYVEYAYRLAMDLRCSAFPVYTDGIKTKADFLAKGRRGLERPEEEILLYERDGVVLGWVHYYWEEDTRYIGPHSILAEKNYGRLLGELLAYWAEHHPGYAWHMYIPEENQEALSYMAGRGYEAAAPDHVDVLLFNDYTPRPEQGRVKKIGPEDFPLFRQVHESFEEGMYWTSDRIEENIERWSLFACMEAEECAGVLYYMDFAQKPRQDLEIFGIDIPDETAHPQAEEELLLAALNHAKAAGANSMYFFNQGPIHQAALGMGFRPVTTAYYFEGELGSKGVTTD